MSAMQVMDNIMNGCLVAIMVAMTAFLVAMLLRGAWLALKGDT